MSKPIVPWQGGKARLAKKILPLYPEHTCYVEPFCGGAALFFRKEPSKVEVLNDLNGDIVNLYRVVQHHLDEFVRQFRWSLISRTLFKWLDETKPETLTDIQRAARFYYLQKLAFGGQVSGRSFGTATTSPGKLNLLRMEEDLSQAHIRLHRATIECLDWSECFKRYDRPHTLFYCDPPYWKTSGYGVAFPFSEYEKMAELGRTIEGKLIISINDTEEIREVFRDFHLTELSINYSTSKQGPTAAKELVLKNF